LQGVYYLKNNIKIFLLFFLLLTYSLIAQQEWERWEKKTCSYLQKDNFKKRDYSFNFESMSDLVYKSLANGYWFFISDLDGDNCPFSPSCSNFLIAAIKTTNLFQGSLIFFDRFARDSNVFGRRKNYSLSKDGKMYDPIDNYLLNKSKVIVHPNYSALND
jgi:putative component of membrane protein insertase Oxa1/YidC/SpoIIIJ protein YidD